MNKFGFIVIVLLVVLFVLGLMNISKEKEDEMSNCTLYQKTLIGDKSSVVCGKTCVTINHHYYNSTYICDQQFKSRIERS